MKTLKQLFHEEGHAEPITNYHVIEQKTALELITEWLKQKRQEMAEWAKDDPESGIWILDDLLEELKQ